MGISDPTPENLMDSAAAFDAAYGERFPRHFPHNISVLLRGAAVKITALQAELAGLRDSLKHEGKMRDSAEREVTQLREERRWIPVDLSQELDKAIAKFPTWPTDPLHALAVLGEEFGELTKDVLQSVYEPHKTSPENVRKEALQTAAMALRFLLSLDRYEYTPLAQHHQALPPQPEPTERMG